MDPALLSPLFALASALLGGAVILGCRPRRRELLVALLAGAVASAAEAIGSYSAGHLGFWKMRGIWNVGGVPLVLEAGGVPFLAGAVLAYDNLWRFPRPAPARAALIAAVGLAYVGGDVLLERFGILRLGRNFDLIDRLPYWVFILGVAVAVHFPLAGRRR